MQHLAAGGSREGHRCPSRGGQGAEPPLYLSTSHLSPLSLYLNYLLIYQPLSGEEEAGGLLADLLDSSAPAKARR